MFVYFFIYLLGGFCHIVILMLFTCVIIMVTCKFLVQVTKEADFKQNNEYFVSASNAELTFLLAFGQ